MTRTVLSIEDDDAAQYLLQMAFREIGDGYQMFRVSNGEEGLAYLRRSGPYTDSLRPDLVLLDLSMPLVSGTEVLARMQEDSFLKTIPVVVFTSSRIDRDRARCLALGARDFLSKPSDFDGVVQAVKTACAYVN
jgi:CheY-like chemotaxis protein